MTLDGYIGMIRAFLDGRLSVDAFERQYLETFKAQPAGMDETTFRALDRLFGAVDSYSEERRPDQVSPLVLSEPELRREASEVLATLDRSAFSYSGSRE